MPKKIIEISGLSKSYLVGHQSSEKVRYVALRDVIGRQVKSFVRKGIDMLQGKQIIQGDSIEEFWALRDLSFDIDEGEVVGIIGRNGAGKSTLLKILSRITEPTQGRVTLHGRVASLLEVGTGFHPELTGRENIFLNGAILGMSRAEIKKKFDEIVDFAGVEKFLDTPVKRYSSGMYVRLAFAVAAHLEPEVLVVDEVLAVGDAQFQKKCLGKMGEVARGGRTVLFVSHNMAAVQSLTRRAIVLRGGEMIYDGDTASALSHYSRSHLQQNSANESKFSGKGAHSAILGAKMLNAQNEPTRHYRLGEDLRLEVCFETDGASNLSLDAFLLDENRTRIGLASSKHFHDIELPTTIGAYRSILNFGKLWLASGSYSIDLRTAHANVRFDHHVDDAIEFSVEFSNPGGFPWDFKHSLGCGSIALPCIAAPTFTPIL